MPERYFLYSDSKIQGSKLLAHGVCTAVAHNRPPQNAMDKIAGIRPIDHEAKLVDVLGTMAVGDYLKVGDAVIVRLADNARGRNL